LSLNTKKFFKVTLGALIIMGLLAAWLGFGDRGFIHLYQKDKERKEYLEKIRQLEEENEKLLKEIDRLHNDKEYIESIARNELGLVKEDEIIYRFEKEDNSTEK
jgi:cell division protein FtsB